MPTAQAGLHMGLPVLREELANLQATAVIDSADRVTQIPRFFSIVPRSRRSANSVEPWWIGVDAEDRWQRQAAEMTAFHAAVLVALASPEPPAYVQGFTTGVETAPGSVRRTQPSCGSPLPAGDLDWKATPRSEGRGGRER